MLPTTLWGLVGSRATRAYVIGENIEP
jgi:hypothetical protein